MKTNNFFKVLVSVVFFFATAAISLGQVENSDYVSIGNASDVTVSVDSVTTGTTTRFYVQPDSYYHPSYVAPGWSLTAGFTWTWSWEVNDQGSNISGAEVNTDNWVEVTWGTASSTLQRIKVAETAPPAYGGCTSDDTSIYVEIVAEPTVTFTANNPGTIIGTDIEVCEGDGDLAGIVQAALSGTRSKQLDWDLTIWTLQADHTTPDTYYEEDLSTTLGAGTPAIDSAFSAGTQETGISGSTFDLTKPAGGFDIIDNKATVYQYTVNGITDRISRKSDYLTNATADATAWTVYDNTTETILITVNPTPKTGPIFHIPNDWAN